MPVKEPEDLLQEKLERIEAGESLETCLVDLPEEEAELLKLAVRLRQVASPARDSQIVAAQRLALLKLARKERDMSTQPSSTPSWRSWLNWLRARPPVVLAGVAAALLFACVSITLLGLGIARWTSPGTQEVSSPPSPSTFTLFLPIVPSPEIRDPQHALLKDAQGLVEVQIDDLTWVVVKARYTLQAGQHLRTGALSSAKLTLYDGSQVWVGPNTELSLDELNAPLPDEPRVVALTQLSGETHHQVTPNRHPDSRYAVHTPAGSGEAMGTAFQVLVASDRLARFNVDQGAVAVTNLDTSVLVAAGQSTTVNVGEPPQEPVFRISGEGEVTQTGETWVIAGQTFQTHDATIIVGNPQVGDWVQVEGRIALDDTRIADLIVLLQRSPENCFTLNGPVEAIEETFWVVAGQTISLTAETEIQEGIEAGDLVQVEGHILPGGALVAERIRRLEELPGLPFEFVGVVQEMADELWVISGLDITVDEETEIDEGLAVGDLVKVEGWILDDGSWLAVEIKIALDEERKFEFTGEVESIDPWVVAGISFETRDWTEIEPGIQVGDRVKVEGHILQDGTWVALEIKRIDDEESGSYIVFVGRVDSLDPWIVSGFPLAVDEDTEIIGDIAVGDWVKVEIEIRPDWTWRVIRITLIDVDPGLGCISVTAIVVSVGDGQLELLGWPPIDLEGVNVEGELEPNSIVLVLICLDEEGRITVVGIIVIYDGGEEIVPTPPGDEGHKVTICHKPNSKNPHTITIDRSALPAHLNHGDTLGPCE